MTLVSGWGVNGSVPSLRPEIYVQGSLTAGSPMHHWCASWGYEGAKLGTGRLRPMLASPSRNLAAERGFVSTVSAPAWRNAA